MLGFDWIKILLLYLNLHFFILHPVTDCHWTGCHVIHWSLSRVFLKCLFCNLFVRYVTKMYWVMLTLTLLSNYPDIYCVELSYIWLCSLHDMLKPRISLIITDNFYVNSTFNATDSNNCILKPSIYCQK